MASETAEVWKDSEVIQKGAGMWAMAHVLEDLVRSSAVTGVSRTAGRTPGGLVSNTKVITDAMDLFTQGERFMRVQEMGRPERPEETKRW